MTSPRPPRPAFDTGAVFDATFRRARHSAAVLWADLQWPVMGVLAVVSLVLGYIGYAAQLRAAGGGPYSVPDVIYLDLMLFTLQLGDVQPPFHAALNVARFLAPAVAGYTALQALAELFGDQLQSLRLRVLRRHVVVAGLGRKGMILTRAFLERGYDVVVIEQDAENDFVRQCRDIGAVVLVGDACEAWFLRKAGVARAVYLFAVCGDDGVNAEVAVRTADILGTSDGVRLTCAVHIVDAQLCLLLREREFDNDQTTRMRLEFFNVFDLGARVLLEESLIEGADPKAGDPPGQMVVVGLGRLAESLVVHAARRWHARHGGSDARLRITAIDRRAREISDEWLLHYPALARVCDLTPVDVDLHAAAFRQGDYLRGVGAPGGRIRAFVCLDNDSLGLSAALALAAAVREQEATIVVRMEQDAGLATLLDGDRAGHGHLARLCAFGLLDRACRPDEILRGSNEVLARAIHEEYVRHQAMAVATAAAKTSLMPWDGLPEDRKESNRQQAEDIGAKLRLIQCRVAPQPDWDEPPFEFSPGELEMLARAEHERWIAEKTRAGWRCGAVMDAASSTHPCLVPFDDLPPDEQEKDRQAVRQIPALLASVGFRVDRLNHRLAPAP